MNCGHHGNDTFADADMVVFVYPPQVTYLHTKIEGGLKFFISNFASLSWRIALKSFSHLIKAAVNWVMPPTNETQGWDPGKGSQQK